MLKACQNRRRADSNDDAGDGAGLGRHSFAELGARNRRRTVLVVPRKREVSPVWGERIAFENPDNLSCSGRWPPEPVGYGC